MDDWKTLSQVRGAAIVRLWLYIIHKQRYSSTLLFFTIIEMKLFVLSLQMMQLSRKNGFLLLIRMVCMNCFLFLYFLVDIKTFCMDILRLIILQVIEALTGFLVSN